MISYDPRLTSGGGNLVSAIGLWNNFFGPQSKQNAANLAATKQASDIAGKQESRAEALQAPTLDQANAAAAAAKAQAEGLNLDLSTRKAATAALNAAPVTLWKPTTEMSPDEFQQWQDLHVKNGATNPDWNKLGTAWNAGMANLHGKLATPKGGITTQFTFDSGTGNTASAGSVIPDMSKISGLFGGVQPPGGAAPAGNQPAGNAPAGGAAPAPGQTPTPQLPSVGDLLPTAMNPFARNAVDWALDTRNKIATGAGKEQEIQKSQRELDYGTTEQQKAESEFIRNAAQMSHRLDQLRSVVHGPYVDSKGEVHPEGFGNYEYSNPEGAALLKSLPLDISDNFTKITNPGGVLREGLVHLGKTEQIPFPEHLLTSFSVKNDTTTAAIDQTKKVLADYVRQYENLPTTKQPVRGLTDEVRGMVGPTRFGKPDDKIFTPEEAVANGPKTQFSSPEEFQSASRSGKVDPRNGPVIVKGVLYRPTPQGWIPEQNAPSNATNSAPSFPLVSPAGVMPPSATPKAAINLGRSLPNLPIFGY